MTASAYSALYAAVSAGTLGTVVFARFTTIRPVPVDREPVAATDTVAAQSVDGIGHAIRVAGPVVRVHTRFTHRPGARTTTSQLVLSHHSGAISHVVATWVHEHPTTRSTYVVTGTGGRLDHDSAAATPLHTRWRAAGDAAAEQLPLEVSEPNSDGVTRAAALAVADAAARSAATGRAVAVGDTRLEGAAS